MPYQKNKRWYTEVWDKYNKKRIRVPVKIKGKIPQDVTRADALRIERIIRGEIQKGTYETPVKCDIRFNDLVDSYLEWAKDNHKGSYELDRSKTKLLLRTFHNKYIHDIRDHHVNAFIESRKKEGKSPETINDDIFVIKRMFNLAVEKGYIKESPINNVKKLHVPEREIETITHEDFIRLLNSSPDGLKSIIIVAYFTGMRRGELRSLQWQHIDFENKFIRLKGENTKNGKGRDITMTKFVYETLMDLKKKNESLYVFSHSKGKPYSSGSAWRRLWNKAVKDSGINKNRQTNLRFHDLRHSYISHLVVDMNIDHKTAMELSGHSDLKTMQRYAHSNEERKKQVAEQLQESFDALNNVIPMKSNS